MPDFSCLAGELLSVELSDNDSTELFTTQRRQDAVIEGEREFADLTECFVRQSTITTSNGISEYSLLSTVNIPSGDYVRPSARGPEYHLTDSNGNVTYTAGSKDFPRRDVETLNRDIPGWRDSTGASMPESWYLREDGGDLVVGLYPPPEIQSSESGQIVWPFVPYYAGSTTSTRGAFELNSTQRLDLRAYELAPVHYAASKLEKLRRDTVASDRQMQLFLSRVQRYVAQTKPQAGSRVTVNRQYFRESRRAGSPLSRDPRR